MESNRPVLPAFVCVSKRDPLRFQYPVKEFRVETYVRPAAFTFEQVEITSVEANINMSRTVDISL